MTEVKYSNFRLGNKENKQNEFIGENVYEKIPPHLSIGSALPAIPAWGWPVEASVLLDNAQSH